MSSKAYSGVVKLTWGRQYDKLERVTNNGSTIESTIPLFLGDVVVARLTRRYYSQDWGYESSNKAGTYYYTFIGRETSSTEYTLDINKQLAHIKRHLGIRTLLAPHEFRIDK